MNSLVAHPGWLKRSMLLLGRSQRAAENLFGPLVDLLSRLWIAQAFIVSGIVKLSN